MPGLRVSRNAPTEGLIWDWKIHQKNNKRKIFVHRKFFWVNSAVPFAAAENYHPRPSPVIARWNSFPRALGIATDPNSERDSRLVEKDFSANQARVCAVP
jgi:hypothetical protein